MKKQLLLGLVLGAALITSCSGSGSSDEADVVTYNKVNVSVDPSDLFSSYTFEDTKHGINIQDEFRTFNSEYGKYIQVRVLFYNKSTDLLVDSIVRYLSDTNTITEQISLPAGDYFAVTTLSFADKSNGDSWWVNVDREKMSTSKLKPLNRMGCWSIMSHASESLTVQHGDQNRLTAKPKPVGTLVYEFYENFQYVSEQTYGTVADNNIRQIALYNRTPGESYNLDPRATNKFNYYADAGSNTWYYADVHRPAWFDSTWTFFKTNLYAYCYLMEPQAELTFGLMHDGETTFNAYGEKKYTLTSGKTFLAYWDYFKVGNPYFGEATNSKWNSYSKAPKVEPAFSKVLQAKPMEIGLESTLNYMK